MSDPVKLKLLKEKLIKQRQLAQIQETQGKDAQQPKVEIPHQIKLTQPKTNVDVKSQDKRTPLKIEEQPKQNFEPVSRYVQSEVVQKTLLKDPVVPQKQQQMPLQGKTLPQQNQGQQQLRAQPQVLLKTALQLDQSRIQSSEQTSQIQTDLNNKLQQSNQKINRQNSKQIPVREAQKKTSSIESVQRIQQSNPTEYPSRPPIQTLLQQVSTQEYINKQTQNQSREVQQSVVRESKPDLPVQPELTKKQQETTYVPQQVQKPQQQNLQSVQNSNQGSQQNLRLQNQQQQTLKQQPNIQQKAPIQQIQQITQQPNKPTDNNSCQQPREAIELAQQKQSGPSQLQRPTEQTIPTQIQKVVPNPATTSIIESESRELKKDHLINPVPLVANVESKVPCPTEFIQLEQANVPQIKIQEIKASQIDEEPPQLLLEEQKLTQTNSNILTKRSSMIEEQNIIKQQRKQKKSLPIKKLLKQIEKYRQPSRKFLKQIKLVKKQLQQLKRFDIGQDQSIINPNIGLQMTQLIQFYDKIM